MTSRVVIIGGGFAGLSTALRLSRNIKATDDIDMLLLDKRREHVYLPLLYKVAAGNLDSNDISVDLQSEVSSSLDFDDNLLNGSKVQFRQGLVKNIDEYTNEIELESGAIVQFDYLVLAMGATHATFNVKGVEENAIVFTTLESAREINRRCKMIIKERCADLRNGVNIIVVGGGANGVEIATALVDAGCNAQITLINAGSRVLGFLGRFTSWRVARRMRKIGINIVNGTIVKEIQNSLVVVEPDRKLKELSPFKHETLLQSDLTIWSTGFKSREEWRQWGLPVDDVGYIQADPTLQVHGIDNMFVAGDSAVIVGRDMQQRAPEAIAQGELVADNLLKLIRGSGILKAHKEKRWPSSVMVGRRFAVGQIGFVNFFGLIGVVFREIIDFRYFMNITNIWTALKIWFGGCKTYLKKNKC